MAKSEEKDYKKSASGSHSTVHTLSCSNITFSFRRYQLVEWTHIVIVPHIVSIQRVSSRTALIAIGCTASSVHFIVPNVLVKVAETVIVRNLYALTLWLTQRAMSDAVIGCMLGPTSPVQVRLLSVSISGKGVTVRSRNRPHSRKRSSGSGRILRARERSGPRSAPLFGQSFGRSLVAAQSLEENMVIVGRASRSLGGDGDKIEFLVLGVIADLLEDAQYVLGLPCLLSAAHDGGGRWNRGRLGALHHTAFQCGAERGGGRYRDIDAL